MKNESVDYLINMKPNLAVLVILAFIIVTALGFILGIIHDYLGYRNMGYYRGFYKYLARIFRLIGELIGFK